MKQKHNAWRSVLLFALGVMMQTGVLAGQCDAILEQGIRNTFQELRNKDVQTAFSAGYCDKSRFSKKAAKDAGLNVGYKVFRLDADYSESDTESAQKENCGDEKSFKSDKAYVSALKLIADQEIVKAWSECNANPFGVYLLGELNDKDLVLHYVFRSAGGVNDAIAEHPRVTGATCDSSVTNGTVITTGGRMQLCKRQGDSAISVVVNTSRNPARFFVPAVVKKKGPTDQELVCSLWQGAGPQPTGCESYCQSHKGPGVPVVCLENYDLRNFPGVGVAPEGYTWCILDRKFSHDPNVQTYCFARETSGNCRCAVVPPGYPQPSTTASGVVYRPAWVKQDHKP